MTKIKTGESIIDSKFKDEDKVKTKIDKNITEICQEVVLKEEIVKMRDDAQQQLIQAKEQLVFWDTRIKQITGSLASYNLMLQKSEKTKSLVLQNDYKPNEVKK